MENHPVSILSPTDLTLATYEKEYDSGEILFLEGEICRGIGYVESGEIVIRSLDPEGRETTIQRIEAGQFFGDVMLFAFEETYLGNVTALTNAKVAFYSRPGFVRMLGRSELTLSAYLNEIAKKTYELKQSIKLLGLPNLRDQILYYLACETKRQKSATVTLPLSQEELAMKMNVCRPSLSRELSRMQKDGLIRCNRRKITVL